MGGILRVSAGGAISGNNTNENFPIAPGEEDPPFIDPSLPMSPISHGVKKYSNLSFTNQAINGVQFNLVDNYVLVNGTATGPINFNIGTIENLNIGTNYKLRGVYNGIPSEIYANVNGAIYSDNGNGIVFPSNYRNRNGVLGLSINSGVSFNNRKLYPEVIKNNFWENSNLKTIADETLKDIADAIRYAGRFVGSFPARLIPDYINQLNTYNPLLPRNEYGVLSLGENGQFKKMFANNHEMNNWESGLIDPGTIYDMSYMFYNTTKKSGSPDIVQYMNNNITNMSYAYCDCSYPSGSPVCGPNVIDMSSAYDGCYNLTGSPVCGPNVTNMRQAYYLCHNLTGSPVCGDNVTNMEYAYYGCNHLTGSPVCGPNVNNMSSTYHFCSNLTGSPVCGDKVTDMHNAYRGCDNLTGSPVCGDKVTDMKDAYSNCYNLTGSPVCGPNVTNMYNAYYGCYNLTGSPVCGPNVTNMSYAYYGCYNLNEIAYFVQPSDALAVCESVFYINSPVNIIIVKNFRPRVHEKTFYKNATTYLPLKYVKMQSQITNFIVNINGRNLISEIGDIYFNSLYNKMFCEEVSNRYE